MAKKDDEAQMELIPELDPKNAKDKAVIDAAKKYIAIVDERREYLEDAKEKEDAAHDRLVEACHSAKLMKFKLNGRLVEIELKEKAKVKAAKVDEDAPNAD